MRNLELARIVFQQLTSLVKGEREGRDQDYINSEWFLGHTIPRDLDQLRSVGLLAGGPG